MSRRVLTADGKIYIEPWKNDLIELSFLKCIPGRQYHAEGYWTVSTDSSHHEEVIKYARKLKLDIDPAWNPPKTRVEIAKTSGLYPYQVDGVAWLGRQRRAILGDEMGLGKSIQSAVALEDNECVLIVCPTNIKYNWKKELEKWRSSYKVTISSSFRWPEKNEAVIISYDALPSWLLPVEKKVDWQTPDLLAATRTTLICDEAHVCKNSRTQRAKKIKQLSAKAKKTWFLTGTPLVNGKVKELMGMLFALNRFDDTFGSVGNYASKFNVPHNGYGYSWNEAGQPNEDLSRILESVMLRRTREEVLPQLPSIQYQNLLIDVDSGTQSLLDKAWEEHEKFLTEEDLPGFEDFATIREQIAVSRIPAMLEFVDHCEEQGVPLVVFSAHKQPVKALRHAGRGIITGETPALERQDLTDAFQNGSINTIALTIKAGGVGINLTRGWLALFVDLDWMPGLNLHAERRLLRIGQRNGVHIVRMVSNHPLDIHLHKLLLRKGKLISATFPTVP